MRRYIKLLCLLMFMLISMIGTSSSVLAEDNTKREFYAVKESTYISNDRNLGERGTVENVTSASRFKLYDLKTNKYIGSMVYSVVWTVSDGSYVKYYSSNAYFEELGSDSDSYTIGNPAISYSGDYGYCKRKISVFHGGGVYTGYAISECDIYGQHREYIISEK